MGTLFDGMSSDDYQRAQVEAGTDPYEGFESAYANPDCTGSTATCPDMECSSCGMRECPAGEPLHFHHDGCPARCGK